MKVHDAHILGPGLAPTPFTADEIRDGCPAGRSIRLLVEADGQEPGIRMNRFVGCDELGATLERTSLTVDGHAVGDARSDRITWHQLQAHASFPAEQTTIHPDRIETPLGHFECLRYTVQDGSTIQTFWFARSAPGMPIKYTTQRRGASSTWSR